MTTQTQTLADFLLARIAEDDPKRALAECAAKRERVALLLDAEGSTDNLLSSYAYHLLTLEARPYADHPDFREEWRP